MAQGKEWKTEERETIIQSLRPFLEMGYSRNKACAFVGLTPSTLSNWVKDDDALGMRLVGWENTNSALALANIKKAIENEGEKATQGDTKMENSWKLVSKLEEGYKDKLDVTSNDKDVTVGGFTFKKNDDNNTGDTTD